VNRHGQLLATPLRRGRRDGGQALRDQTRLRFEWFAGHSLRAGLATSAAASGKSERAIMNQTGHRSVATVRRYIREGSLFRENAADGLEDYNELLV
jgi:integrase